MAGMVVTASMGVMNLLVKKLTALLGDEYRLLKDARHEVASLRDEMSSVGALLARMDGMEALDAQQAEWRRKVREMSYDMDDCVDRFVHSLGDGGCGSGNSKAAGGVVAQLMKLRARRDLASQIHKLKARVEDASRRRGRYRLQIDDYAALGNQQPSASHVTMDPRISALYEEATALVGIDASLRKIIGWLTDEEEGEEGASRLRVVSILGFGGIGKSTLARRAYNETRGQFDCSAFVSVSRSPNMNRIFADILSGVGAQCDVSTDSEHQLIDKLREHLQDKRYLIVIDDIWSENAWKIISCAFVENYRRSRVITTTRHQNVASVCLHTRNFHGHVHTVEPLNEADSRRLFFRRVFNSEDCPEEFQTTSEQILKKCGGVPLAIISLASTLACHNNVMVIETWEKMLSSLGYLLETSPTLEWMRHVLDLSYRDLCPNLRTCMLYLGIFPEDWVISKDDLVRRWIAEGFVCDTCGCVPEELAEGYFIELINRSIIQVAEFNEYNEAISCRVHDIMLDFIISKATEDNFFAIVGTADQHIRTGNPSVRRVSFRIDHMECDRVISNLDLSRARSLDLWACAYCRPCLSSMSFSLLRVLHLDVSHWSNDSLLLSCKISCGIMGRSPPPPLNKSNFCDLTIISKFHLLKYLKITSSRTSVIFGTMRMKCRLPEQIRTLQYLRTLDIDADLYAFPEDVCEAASLSAIIVSVNSAPKLPHGIGRLKALRILKGFSVHGRSVEDIRGLGELSNLRELELVVGTQGEPEAVALADALCKLSSWDNLRSLVLGSRWWSNSNIGEVLSSWSPPHRLQRLQVRLALFRMVPDWTPLLSRIAFLDFRVQMLSSGGLDALARLPSLAHLALDVDQVLLPEGKLAIHGAAFPRLEKFCFSYRVPCDLVFEPGSMPHLHTLDVRFDATRVIVATPSGFVPIRSEHLRFLNGIEHLQNLTSFTARIYKGWMFDEEMFRVYKKAPMNASHIGSPQELDRWILHIYAGDLLRLALSRHPGHPSVQIKYE